MKKFRYLRKELVNYQTEGTWALPDNPRAKKELKSLMAKPLILGKEGDEAADKLYNIIGDDELFDDLFVAGKKNPKGDARPIVQKAMKRLKIKEDVTEKKKETVKDFLKRGGKITKVKGGTGKAGRAAMDKFKKSFGKMKDKETEKDQEIDEGTDIFNKGGVHVTRYSAGKGKLGFQFNFGPIGRYIQVPLEKLSVLDQAVKMAKKAGKSGKQGDLPIADDVNEKTDRWYKDQPEWGTPESTDHAKRMTPGEYAESTAEYAKSLEKIARDRQLAAISDKDKQTLMKIAALLSKEKKK